MGHSIVAFKTERQLIRDSVLRVLIERLGDYANEINLPWLAAASREWDEHWLLMPPGAKRIELDRWVSDDARRLQFVAALDYVERNTEDPTMKELLQLPELRAFVQP